MKLITFRAADGREHIGAVLADGKRAADFTASDASPVFADMLALIDGGPAALERAKAIAAAPKVTVDLASVQLLAPLPRPRYRRGQGVSRPAWPHAACRVSSARAPSFTARHFPSWRL